METNQSSECNHVGTGRIGYSCMRCGHENPDNANPAPKARHTAGEWEVRDNKVFVKGETKSIAVIHVCKNYEDRTFEPIDDVEAIANAALIAEAGTVANETGLTPRQLLEQRNELLEALKKFQKCYQDLFSVPLGKNNEESLKIWFTFVTNAAQMAVKKVTE